MAQTKLALAILFILLTFFQELCSIEGRHLKLGHINDIPKLHTNTKISNKEDMSKTAYANEAVPTALKASMTPSGTVGESQTIPPPPPPPTSGHVSDFRPTTPDDEEDGDENDFEAGFSSPDVITSVVLRLMFKFYFYQILLRVWRLLFSLQLLMVLL
ncbi:hypothetical protein LguiB_009245 [Lonicera macranthoides]